MIDGAFTATHRLFSHTDCTACVCVCAHICVDVFHVGFSKLHNTKGVVCVSLMCAKGVHVRSKRGVLQRFECGCVSVCASFGLG